MAEATVSTGGMALDASGQPADLPRALAGKISSELLKIVTLLHVAADELPFTGPDERDADNMTSKVSRTQALINMAEDKARDLVRLLYPYD